MNAERMKAHFRERYGGEPSLVVRAPGRVNLIGEHTDYNDGFVLPMAIDRAVWIALEPMDGETVEVHSLNFNETGSFLLKSFAKTKMGWIEYLKGVAWAFQEKGLVPKGFRGVMWGDVPSGAGLSSSAAVELAMGRALDVIGDFGLPPLELALLGQKAENHWVGVNCGIMDQLISAAGEEGHALLIDCRSLQYEPVPLPGGTRVVIMDTSTRRGLESSAYNERRAQCEAGAKSFGKSHLRDVDLDKFEQGADEMDPLTRKRSRHVVSENQRVLDAARYLEAGDVEAFGRLMNASHESLRDDFEVSSQELNAMQEVAVSHPACFGARMTGAGFGGCAVALVKADGAEDFSRAISEKYRKSTGLEPNIYICQATRGAEAIR